jgi:hypothetical protein
MGIAARVRRVVRRGLGRKTFAEQWYDRKGPDPRVPQRRATELKRRGFFAGCDLLYDFEKYGFDVYANDRDFFYMHPINGSFSRLIDDKRNIPILFRQLHHLVPELSIGLDGHRVLFVMENGEASKPNDSLRKLLEHHITKWGALFAKPAGSSGGRGVFRIDEQTISGGLDKIRFGPWLVNNCVQSEAYAKAINPANLNTIRAYFYRNPESGLVFKAFFHRFGTTRSGHADNVSGGGMACGIDVRSGRFKRAFAQMLDPIWRDHHTDSGHVLTDFAVPDWDSKLRDLHAMLENVNYLDYGAMDVAPTSSGLKLLEINSLASRRLLQGYEPAFLDSGFRAFCKQKGYGTFSR